MEIKRIDCIKKEDLIGATILKTLEDWDMFIILVTDRGVYCEEIVTSYDDEMGEYSCVWTRPYFYITKDCLYDDMGNLEATLNFDDALTLGLVDKSYVDYFEAKEEAEREALKEIRRVKEIEMLEKRLKELTN